MKRVVILALAASSLLLLNPLPGFTRGSQPPDSSARGSYSRGSHQQGARPSGTLYRGDHGRRGSAGVYSHRGYRRGGYSHGGYRPAHWRYPYWRYPHRSDVDVYFGGMWIEPGWGTWWGPAWPYTYPSYPYYYPYYSAPPLVIEQAPTEYIQRDEEAVEPEYRYYCRDPEGYYPDVERCPGGWMKVAPSDVAPDQEEE